MNWRRGVLLAGIHLAITVPVIIMLEAEDWRFFRDQQEQTAAAAAQTTHEASPKREEQSDRSVTVAFDPCAMIVDYPLKVQVVQAGEPWAVWLTGWRSECHATWSLAARLNLPMWGPQTASKIKLQRIVDLGFCLLLAVEWLFVGGLPLIHPRQWWLEPGVFITICYASACSLAFIPAIDAVGRLPALVAYLGWLVWLCLFIWTAVRSLWSLVNRRATQPA